ncbi:uncharacterized protein METZ01_LOCUS13712 [marine metagenome]|uniref:Asn/Gln amidotransferase domain-containing protein n=1 Tax=marine metagenome TaxID=408172 RepID=A0A381P3Q6_9ZZZZ
MSGSIDKTSLGTYIFTFARCYKPMSLKEKLLSNMKEAMKAKDSVKLGTVRSVISAVKNQEIELKKELSEEEILTIVSREVKKRKEASVLYEKGNRPELKDKEIQEMKILQTYLPEQVSEKDLRRRIQEVIAETGAEGMKDFGKIMKTLVPEFKGKADNGLIKELANEYLN